MAKMTDKKPAKAKTKVKVKAATKAKKAAAAAAAHAKPSTAALTTTVRQPGVERRRNHPTRSKDGYMEILLTHTVPHFGQPGDLVKVRPGFARNYLPAPGSGHVRDPAQPADRREASPASSSSLRSPARPTCRTLAAQIA